MKRDRKEEEGERCTNPSTKERSVLKDCGGFKCKTCNKKFQSFQALGGHRASHNKLKQVMISERKPKMHMCPICGLEFAIGQALGGHMRKHRVKVAPNHDGFNFPVLDSNVPKRLRLCLDLNSTPYENDLKYHNLNL